MIRNTMHYALTKWMMGSLVFNTVSSTLYFKAHNIIIDTKIPVTFLKNKFTLIKPVRYHSNQIEEYAQMMVVHHFPGRL